MKKYILAILALFAVVLVATPASAASKPDPAAACKDGGYSQYVDPATGQPFVDQGTCVTFVRDGGTLLPVLPPVHGSIGFQPGFSGTCSEIAVLYNVVPNRDYSVQWLVNGAPASGFTNVYNSGNLDPTGGLWYIGGPPVNPGDTVTLIVNGQTVTQQVASC